MTDDFSYEAGREKVIAEAGSPAQALAKANEIAEKVAVIRENQKNGTMQVGPIEKAVAEVELPEKGPAVMAFPSWRNEMTKNAWGGTELQRHWLGEFLGEEALQDFQIVLGRMNDVELSEDKWRILWVHDLASDPCNHHLKHGGWKKFHAIAFVSNWQKDQYLQTYNIPPSKTVVVQNAIRPILPDIGHKMASSTFNIIYHTTPHRGLEILVPVMERLAENFKDKVHLDVFSSFGVYGWAQRDEPYKPLFEQISNHPAMTYHGSQPNEAIRKVLANKAHCFAYPSIWPETSCISLMEAMSAGCLCIHPNFAALPETAANWTLMYNFHENPNQHAITLYSMLATATENHFNNDKMNLYRRAENQSAYTDTFYNWEVRKYQWKSFLDNVRKQPKDLPKSGGVEFVFDTSNPNEGGFIG